jgi:hypothetical protein
VFWVKICGCGVVWVLGLSGFKGGVVAFGSC